MKVGTRSRARQFEYKGNRLPEEISEFSGTARELYRKCGMRNEVLGPGTFEWLLRDAG